MISAKDLDYRQICLSIMLLSYYLVKFKYTIIAIVLILVFLINCELIYTCFFRTQSNHILN